MTYLRAKRLERERERESIEKPLESPLIHLGYMKHVAVSSFILTLENSHQTHENEAQLPTLVVSRCLLEIIHLI
jgi:hypothetical protein